MATEPDSSKKVASAQPRNDPSSPFRKDTPTMSIAVLGEALIDLIIGKDGAYHPHLGGSPYNVAIGLARQGLSVSYMSPLSEDTFGAALRNSLIAEHIRLPIARRSPWPTSLALVTVDANGLPAYRLYREGIADKDFSVDEIDSHLPPGLRLFHTGSLAITPSQLPKIRQLFERLRKRDVLISVDINIRLGASIDTDAYLQGVRSLLPACDIVKTSDEDIDALKLDADTRHAATIAYAEMGTGLLVLTCGSGGSVLFSHGSTIERPAAPVPKIADTVGAGDTFHAAFLAALFRAGAFRGALGDIPCDALVAAVDYAGKAAAINIARTGCRPPTHEEVLAAP